MIKPQVWKTVSPRTIFRWCSNGNTYVTTQIIPGLSFITAHVAYASRNKTKLVWINTTFLLLLLLFFTWGGRASCLRACLEGWTLCCFHSLISTHTFWRALTASVDNCAETECLPLQWRNQFWQSLDKVSESDARSVPVRTTRHLSDSGNAHVCTSHLVLTPTFQTRAETPAPGLLSNDTLESISTTPLTYSSAPSTRKTTTQL